ncbi:MAG: TetR/AcrR family transcriptional regulator [Spirochaetales bacterium]|nr:TetR/AcrR family transcriptional regulator [Spirochaetales bacterium]
MKKRAEYKSSIRSKKLIREAYIELLQEKSTTDKITVTDIVKKADINRGTFYNHYDYPREILEQMQDELLNKMAEFIGEFRDENLFEDPLPLLKKAALYFSENIEVHKKLINTRELEIFIATLKDVFVEKIYTDINLPETLKNDHRLSVMANFISGGIVNLYQAWLKGKLDCSLDELFVLISELIKTNIDFFN